MSQNQIKKEFKVLKDDNFELLKGQKIDNYRQFLSHEGHEVKNEEIENIRLDATGYSSDLARRFGQDYNKGRLIITTVNQRDDIVIRDDNTFLMSLINYIYSKQEIFDLINDITLKEVILGKFSCQYDRKFRRLIVEIYLETPGNSIKRLTDIKQEINTLRSDPYRMLSKSRNEKLRKLIKEPYDISEKFPSIEIFRIPENNMFPLKKQIECFRESGKDGDVYYFVGQRNIIIHFTSVTPNVYLGDDVDIFLNGENKEQVLNILFRHGYIGFRDDLTNKALDDIAWESILGGTVSTFLPDLYNVEVSQSQIKAKVTEYQKIRNRVTNDNTQNNIIFRELDFLYKKDLVEPKQHRREIQEILSKIEPENPIKMYRYDGRRFKHHFNTAKDDEKKGILNKIACYLNRTQKHNLIVNTWLAEHHFKVCKEAGVRFVV